MISQMLNFIEEQDIIEPTDEDIDFAKDYILRNVSGREALEIFEMLGIGGDDV